MKRQQSRAKAQERREQAAARLERQTRAPLASRSLTWAGSKE